MTAGTDVYADLVTPLGAYLRLREPGQAGFLLESVEKGRLGRYSLVGSGSRLVGLDEAEREAAAGAAVVGYVGYDYVARLEPSVPLPDKGPGLPETRFVVADTLVRFDHVASVAEVLAGDRCEVARRLDPALAPSFPAASRGSTESRPRTRRHPGRREYEARVRRGKEYVRAGDAFQIVLSQRAERATQVSPPSLYRALRRVNPSPYLFLLELGEVALVGSSPETLVRLEPGSPPAAGAGSLRRASVNPIAGTTTAGKGDEDRLLASEKDRAEHVMLVDLGRNDLARACRPGSVHVRRFLEAERYSHVTHLVSEVAGELLPQYSPFDLLRACFPAGTVSGAPKVRAMQIISELEGYRRGPYAGAVGYALPERRLEGSQPGVVGAASLETCIAIRTIVLADGLARLQAGAGVVAGSDPAAEHEECLSKLAALETAIELAERSSR
ncbi:MAG: anthranilate synthase component I family protein [Actinomycetota bacterium]|nr:anthranilate synthase component I family protein [Actinomycetota bacterium]